MVSAISLISTWRRFALEANGDKNRTQFAFQMDPYERTNPQTFILSISRDSFDFSVSHGTHGLMHNNVYETRI